MITQMAIIMKCVKLVVLTSDKVLWNDKKNTTEQNMKTHIFTLGGCIILEILDFFKMIMSNISRACQFV